MHFEFGAFDDVDRGDEGVDDEGDGGAVVERDGVAFAVDTDGGLGTAGYQDGLINRGGELDRLGWAVEVLDNPFVAVEVFASWFLRPHALRFGLFAG